VYSNKACDKVCQLHVADWWFSTGTPVSSTNKIDRHKTVMQIKGMKVG